MVSILLGGAIVRLCILYSRCLQPFLPFFLHLLSLPFSVTPSLPLSSHPVSALIFFLSPFHLSSIPGLVYSQLTLICHTPILKAAKLGKVPKYNLVNTIYQIVKFTLFKRYCFLCKFTHFISASGVLSDLQQRYSFSSLPQAA